MGDQQIALQARLMSQALRKLTGSLSKSNCTIIFLNQIRQKVGVIFGSPEVTSGGTALRYYASVRLDIRRKTAIKEGDQVVGNETVVKVAKNKLASPFKIANFDMMFGHGIDRQSELNLLPRVRQKPRYICRTIPRSRRIWKQSCVKCFSSRARWRRRLPRLLLNRTLTWLMRARTRTRTRTRLSLPGPRKVVMVTVIVVVTTKKTCKNVSDIHIVSHYGSIFCKAGNTQCP
uniref:RecA family profile 2 domain-containing protein n=1 Tax=Hyaloperonospora arabidopsidis (strain Emoy2) TaxID=559515 RepID=M4BPH2_HYAAE